MTIRRHFSRAILATVVLAMPFGLSWAAQPTIEIIAMAHPPVQNALKPLREWLVSQGSKVRVVELDAESPQGEKRLYAVGQRGHIPIAILIDGKMQFRRKDGTGVTFLNFPAVKESPAGIRGDWLTEDVQAALLERVNRSPK
jgi:hypothetical protein